MLPTIAAPARAGEPAKTPGRARICLTDDEVKLRPGDTLTIPATTVFEDEGPNEGKRDDPSTWRHETQVGEDYRAAFVTMAPIALTASAKCAEVEVKMSTGILRTATAAKAADSHLYRIADVVAYPVPKKRPPVEIGKLIDDISVMAVLLKDVNDSVPEPAPLSEADATANCLSGATKLAATIGAGVGGHSAINVQLGGTAAHEASYTCSSNVGRDSPGLFVAWDESARPPAATLRLIAKGGEYLTGAPKAEILAETAACVAAALKPGNDEMANRQFRGVKIECTAFARDGGGGTVDIYRRFGAPPAQAEPSAEARQRLDVASRAMALDAEEKAADARRFAEWYQDPAIPKDVKVFAMMASRVIALNARCPSAKSHSRLIDTWATSAGISPGDIEPHGRYFDLMVTMLAAAKKDVDATPVATACEAAAKYD